MHHRSHIWPGGSASRGRGLCIRGSWADPPPARTRKAGSTHNTGMLPCFVTGRNEVLAKVIFLHLSVILFTGGIPPNFRGGYLKFSGGGVSNFRGGCLKFSGGGVSSGIRSTFGRYASYWNAFLFCFFPIEMWYTFLELLLPVFMFCMCLCLCRGNAMGYLFL